MGTKAEVRVVGCTKSGNWIVQPLDECGLQVLMDCRLSGEPLGIGLTIPTRGIQRKRFRDGLRLVGGLAPKPQGGKTTSD